MRRVVNRNHMFDATEIFRTLSVHKKGESRNWTRRRRETDEIVAESFFKLGF